MEVESGGGGPNPIAELVTALEQATLMAKQLPVAADPSRLHHIHSSLHLAQLRLPSFLSRPPPPPPSAPENSLLSAVAYEDEDDDRNGNGNSPMQVADDDDIGGGELHPETIERVEERMRDCCFIQNKRPKRPLSPSADHQPRSSSDTYLRPMSAEFDPHRTRLRSLDLVSQFHA